jgi:hypothetical protein
MELKKCTARKKIFVLGRPGAAQAEQKSLVPARQAQGTNQGRNPFICRESPFTSVSTVSKGHPFIVSLADTSTEPYADNAVYECLTLSYSLQDPVFK